jgi:hypothetical protein
MRQGDARYPPASRRSILELSGAMLYGAKLYPARFAQTTFGAAAALLISAAKSKTADRLQPPLLA